MRLPFSTLFLPGPQRRVDDYMEILIVNGSPAGEESITLQTALYIEEHFPQHAFQTIHVGKHVKLIEKDFSTYREKLIAADVILFCYPVYTFLVPAQLYRFLEIVKDSGLNLDGKYATQISTSKHFFDITA